MNCWHCDRPSHGACAFCGRAVCKEHARTMPNFVAVYRGLPGKGKDGPGALKAIAVEDALFCGVCRPREQPVDIPELDT